MTLTTKHKEAANLLIAGGTMERRAAWYVAEYRGDHVSLRRNDVLALARHGVLDAETLTIAEGLAPFAIEAAAPVDTMRTISERAWFALGMLAIGGLWRQPRADDVTVSYVYETETVTISLAERDAMRAAGVIDERYKLTPRGRRLAGRYLAIDDVIAAAQRAAGVFKDDPAIAFALHEMARRAMTWRAHVRTEAQ